ncbi:uncharacterized protein PFL1_01118 [Pseudozyma flocculosa PF-1]|uniref:GPN-loop GTPase n=1 Tax=Pseudozyma flocculosa TaxID=84751 RepID=A0A5C3FBK0_9BASI|nr:uncharacterized protein PFL1_01118 [Pseudozyma flocculosa PF-1]EPQ31786.1 hypothetical protein PFL1_01118 [Pseudozyma flocculosa PF-1]SPO41824.1 related to XPA binding protein [Pseudozyma flocculosa]
MATAQPSTSAAASAAAPADGSASLLPPIPQATSIIVIGMAGSGKSTFTSALSSYHETSASSSSSSSSSPSSSSAAPPYMVNLDPAVGSLGYEPNVDIRDTVDYRRVMQQYNLGPNGGILTALNLFTTKFDQVLGILEKRANETDHIVLDTPGQIEIFTWSASGSIVTDALASAMPTVVAYIIDTPRTTAPATFMSNMLYACSILYKTKLPFILVFNKTDAQPHDFALEWMHDFEKFQEALKAGNATEPSLLATAGARGGGNAAGGPTEEQGYMNSLMNSMSLVLDEFYKNLRTVGVSSLTGDGLPSFFEAVNEARQEYITDYRPDLERLAAQRKEKREGEKRRQLEKLMRDMQVDSKSAAPRPAAPSTREDGDGEEEEEGGVVEEEYEGDGQIIEPDSDEEKPHYDYPGPEYDRGDGTVWPRPG